MNFFKNIKGWWHRWMVFTGIKTDLSYCLSHADPKASLGDKIYWLEQLFEWIRSSSQLPHGFNTQSGQLHSVRIRFILQILDRNPEWKLKTAATLRSILIESSGVSLFSQAGLSQEAGFIGEILDRVSKKILPTPAQDADLSQVFYRIFTSSSDAAWIESISPEVASQIMELIQAGDPEGKEAVLKSIGNDLTDALLILGARVESLGLTPEIRHRIPEHRVIDSPFLKLNRDLQVLGSLEALPELLAKCRKDVDDVYSHIENSGVSVALVFRLETISTSLSRIAILAELLGKLPRPKNHNPTSHFLSELVYENIRKNSVRELFKTHLHLLASKIVERTGLSGEHYIARDRQEWVQMFTAAWGGGLVTVFTTFIKFFITAMAFPPFFEGFFYWINYSGSFLLMQAMGFTLATKQPSATAPALAGKLRDIEGDHQVDSFVNEVILMIRSQFAAAVGNIGAVIPGSIIMSLAYKSFFGTEVMTPTEAQHWVASFHPFHTLTILYGATTGVVLWISSIAGGWLENWVVFHQLPEAFAGNRHLNRVFGAERCKTFSKKLLQQTGAFGINVSLGFLLAFTPFIGKFFGFTLEVKHVTLSSGALSFAITSLPPEMRDTSAILMAWMGIACIGLMNFGVSFALALATAQRARRVRSVWIWRLMQAVRKRFFKNPFAFFFAPVQSTKAPSNH